MTTRAIIAELRREQARELEEEPTRNVRRFVIVSVLSACCLLAGGVMAINHVLNLHAADLHRNLATRLTATAEGKADAIEIWLEGHRRAARGFAKRDAVIGYAPFVAEGMRPTDRRDVAARREDLQALLSELTATHGLGGAYLADRETRQIVTHAGAAKFDATLFEQLDGPTPPSGTVSTIRPSERGPLLNLVVPLDAPGRQVLVVALEVEAMLVGLLAEQPVGDLPIAVRLLQSSANGTDEIEARDEGLRIAPSALPLPGGIDGPIGYREIDHGRLGPLLIAGDLVESGGFAVVASVHYDAALRQLARLRVTAYAVLVAFLAALAGGAGIVWYRQHGAHHEEMATQYRDLAAQIQKQRMLLENITNSIKELIGLKTLDGRYMYVNPPFLRAVQLGERKVLGMSDRDIFPPETAEMLASLDEEAIALGRATVEDCVIELGGKRCYVNGSKTPLCDENGVIVGVVTVLHEVTAMVEERIKREKTNRQTVMALVRAIELSDPYLVGHTKRIQHYAGEIGRRLGLDERDMATLDLAASLSQLGKIFVPQSILRKPGRHTPEESKIMRTHIKHAVEVINDIDFDLPVTPVVAQIYERLDGSGYPQGLAGDEIGLLARALAVVDVFCARTEPRSYREQITPNKALYYLATNPQRYDIRMVEVLAEVVRSVDRQQDHPPETAKA